MNLEHTKFEAAYISAPEDYLKSLITFPDTTLPMGKWINSVVTRNHFRRDVILEKDIFSAYAEFQSDNPFDLYINGTKLEAYTNCEGYHIIPCSNIKELLHNGSNALAIRYYTNNNPLKAVTAIRGNIVIKYSDSSVQEIPTDSSWQNGTVCNFWRGTEPEDWQTAPIPDNYDSVNEFAIYPALLRRSCYFKKTFTTTKPIKDAVLFVSSCGTYVPYLNSERITDGRFLSGSMIGYTEYRCYNVTEFLANGQNTLGFYTGNGHQQSTSWGTLDFEVPAVLAQLEITYADGSAEVVLTDESWLVTASPLLDNDLQYGERYDARLECINWCSAEETSDVWHTAKVRDFHTLKAYKLADYAPVRIQKEYAPIAIGEALGGEYKLYDFGINSAGRAKITLKNTKKGEVILLRYCEILDGDTPRIEGYGDVYYSEDTRHGAVSEYGARNIDVYICKGGEEEIYLPEFTYTGFRYVYIKGYSGAYTNETVHKVEMNTDLTVTGSFQCSNENLNKIWDAVTRSYRSNIFTGPTDCPTREKNFWNGDISYFAAAACWYMDNNTFLSRWTDAGKKLQYDIYGWEDEEYILPLTLYKYYGNREILAVKYPVIKALINKRVAQLNGNILPQDHSPYNDHQATKNVPADFFAAAYYCRMWRDAAVIADVLNEDADKKVFTEHFQKAVRAFNDTYYDAENKTYLPKNQTAIVLPLAFDIAESENIKSLCETLHGYIAADDYRLTCGFSSIEYILSILCDNGYGEDAWKIINCDTFPSLLHMIDTYNGGTITESWHSSDAIIDSMNHYGFGCLTRWFFEYLGGIKIKKANFDEIEISPYFYQELERCTVSYLSSHGEIRVHIDYDKASESFQLALDIPNDVIATLKVPNNLALCYNNQCIAEHSVTLTGDQHTTVHSVVLTGGSYLYTVTAK